MSSENLINRAYRNLCAGIPVEEIRLGLLSSGESEYDCWLAYVAAEVAAEQNTAMEQNLSLEDYRRILQAEDEEYNKYVVASTDELKRTTKVAERILDVLIEKL